MNDLSPATTPPRPGASAAFSQEATDDFVRDHLDADVRALALRTTPPQVDIKWALQQIEGRQLAARKLPEWALKDGLWWPPRLALEQCSSMATARYKAAVIAQLPTRAGSFIDLTGGFGVDFCAIAPLFEQATHVERNAELSRIVQHNLPWLGLTHAKAICDEAEAVAERLAEADVVMVDPARRDTAGRKMVRIEDCTPDIVQLMPTLRPKVRFLCIKLSPMLDISAALRAIPHTSQLHAVSLDGECKELLLVVPDDKAPAEQRNATVRLFATLLRSDGDGADGCHTLSFTQAEEQQTSIDYADAIGQWLYEPDPAVLKAGAVKLAAQRFGLLKLAPMSHLYTSDALLEHWPGKRFQVEKVFTFSHQDLRTLLAETPRAGLTVRGFPQSVAQLRTRLKIKEGGECQLFATTLAQGQKIIVRTRRCTDHTP